MNERLTDQDLEDMRIAAGIPSPVSGIDVNKQAQTYLHGVLGVEFMLDNGTSVDAVIVGREQDYAVGVVNEVDADGVPERRYVRLPKRLAETQQAALEFYKDHDSLKKGVGATAIIAAAIVARSLYVKRRKKLSQ
ncbi:MAG TPA: hypothetical protein VFN56_04045 [Candidatus Saccharimonadales bacterium]|nr:hypothetical protein [Candidatus Saccharimonadales bacterium]